MSKIPNCPSCGSEFAYESNHLFVCPMCSHEWSTEAGPIETEQAAVVKDANGNVLLDGDTVTLIKNLKVKGAQSDLKMGTKVKNIRLLPTEDHNIDCKIEGFGPMRLKSEFVKKA